VGREAVAVHIENREGGRVKNGAPGRLDASGFEPVRVLVERAARSNPGTDRILSRLGNLPIEEIESANDWIRARSRDSHPEPACILAVQKGRFLKPCPCSPGSRRCGYHFLNLVTNCTLGCSYCILQEYLANPFLTLYTNFEDCLREVARELDSRSGFMRIGTGELTDSLLLDPLVDYNRRLVSFFSRRENAVLELKTKTDRVDPLLSLDHGGRVIVSWSLAPDAVIRREEGFAASLAARLDAAERCVRAGYPVGFHFDPLLYYEGWEEDYRTTVDRLFERIEAERISWVSLGTLRYPAGMERRLRERHPRSGIYLAESFPGPDGKMRYFRPLRQRMYSRLRSRIREHDRTVAVYLCMETEAVWRSVFGAFDPGRALRGLLDRAAECREGKRAPR
jgi:spore photoproduct lyase